MESLISFFEKLFQTPGSIGVLALGFVIGFFILRLWAQNLQATEVWSMVGLSVGGGGLTGIVGYFIENKLFAYLDAYGTGLVIGFVVNVIFRILAGVLEGLANALRQITGAAVAAAIRNFATIFRFLAQR